MTNQQLLYTPEEAASALRIGRTRLYQLLNTGELPSVTVGRSRRITATALERFVDSLVDHSPLRQ